MHKVQQVFKEPRVLRALWVLKVVVVLLVLPVLLVLREIKGLKEHLVELEGLEPRAPAGVPAPKEP